MSYKRNSITLCLALLLTLSVPATAATLEETEQQTLPFSAGDRLDLSNTNGSILIETWDRDEIQIEARKKAKAPDDDTAQEVMQAIRIEISQTGRTTEVETHLPRKQDGISGWLSGRNVSASVAYKVHLPRNADLDLVTVNGAIKIYEVHGVIDARSTNGGITVSDAGGAVTASTTNGGIEVELNEVASGEDMSLRTTNGSIRLRLPSEVSADLSARTTNGSIHTDLPIQVTGSMSRSRIEGEINGGGGRLELRTTNGSIKIQEL